MGNSPVAAAVAIGSLALHALILSPRAILAEEASSAAAADRNRPSNASGPRVARTNRLRKDHRAGRIDREWDQRYRTASASEGSAAAAGAAIEGGDRTPSASVAPIDEDGIIAARRRLKPCMGYHMNLETGDGCTDDANYPEEWPGLRTAMFHATAGACCEQFGGDVRDCRIVRTGCRAGTDPAALPSLSSLGCRWHPEMTSNNMDGCSNDDDFPIGWEDMEGTGFFFGTAQECCDNFFPATECKTYDRGCQAPPPAAPTDPPRSCVTPGWHADLITQDGCTNDENFPELWLTVRSMFQLTSAECCSMFFRNERCRVKDRCSVDPNMVFTPRPQTPPPTISPAPTTIPPTPAPTLPPTPTPQIFYIEYDTGLCMDDAEFPRPHYITQIFPDALSCCSSSFATEKCLQALPGDDGEPLPEYYLPYGSLICVDSKAPGINKPHYISNTFRKYGECCREVSPDAAQCLEESPEGYDPSEIPDTIIEVHMYGSVLLKLSSTPRHNIKDWSTLKSELIKRIISVMIKSSIVLQGIVVELLTLAGQSSKYQSQGKLEESAIDGNNEVLFEITLPARCNAVCQFANGPIGQNLSDELESHLKYYIYTGAFSSILQDIMSLGRTDEHYMPPQALGGTLAYGSAHESSSRTFIPTWSPTEYSDDTVRPTGEPTESQQSFATEPPTPLSTDTSTERPQCESAKWHPLEDFSAPTCTNSYSYPGLWNSQSNQQFFLFESAVACCRYYSFAPLCNTIDICDAPEKKFTPPFGDGNRLITPSKKPTKQPTKQPTKNPTTSKPTRNPIVEFEWYVEGSSNTCVQDCEGDLPCGGPMQEWNSNSKYYGSARKCCANIHWKTFEQCVMSELWAPISSPTEIAKPTYPPGPDWYLTADTNRCVQDCKGEPPCGGRKKSEWSDSYFSAEECCASIYWKPLMDCMLTAVPTVIPTQTPTEPRTTTKPTANPTEPPSLSPSLHFPTSLPTTECSYFKWYYDANTDACINDSSYPSLWDYEPELGSKFQYGTPSDCCVANFPGSYCAVKDVCDLALPSYCGALYHPTIHKVPDERTCTNSHDYPSTWKTNTNFMFQSAEACCNAYYDDGLCMTKNACYK